jgi:hypothetical protein
MKLSQLEQKARPFGCTSRFITQKDMAIIKHDAAVYNTKVKRGEIVPRSIEYIGQPARKINGNIYACSCGAVGCFVHV